MQRNGGGRFNVAVQDFASRQVQVLTDGRVDESPSFAPNGRMILHCASGGRSALAVETLKTMGYANVAHLDGGFNAWKAAGHPVEETVVA